MHIQTFEKCSVKSRQTTAAHTFPLPDVIWIPSDSKEI